jgi:hypothetical protein
LFKSARERFPIARNRSIEQNSLERKMLERFSNVYWKRRRSPAPLSVSPMIQPTVSPAATDPERMSCSLSPVVDSRDCSVLQGRDRRTLSACCSRSCCSRVGRAVLALAFEIFARPTDDETCHDATWSGVKLTVERREAVAEILAALPMRFLAAGFVRHVEVSSFTCRQSAVVEGAERPDHAREPRAWSGVADVARKYRVGHS